ncbi:hypothetical protein KC331_g49 [Hortaea werneckii]|nr:hypothetical protein KC331_g49 [Hortaea werneckii]
MAGLASSNDPSISEQLPYSHQSCSLFKSISTDRSKVVAYLGLIIVVISILVQRVLGAAAAIRARDVELDAVFSILQLCGECPRDRRDGIPVPWR